MIKIGFIGCGGITRRHAMSVPKVKGLRIAAAADIATDTLANFGRDNGVEALYADYKEMLAKEDLDAVNVSLPTGLHREAAVAAAKAGLHVFCEKPMAMSLKDCDAMMKACDDAGVVLLIAQCRRYDAFWGAFKKVVDSGAIGRPILWRQAIAAPGPGRWFMDARMGGGPFMDGCVHNWDFANCVFGEPVEAVGSLMRLYQDSALDTGSATVRYASGDEITLNWSWGMPQGCSAGRGVHVALGPKGVIRFPETLDPGDYPEGFDHEKYGHEKYGAFMVDTGAKKRLVKFRKNDMYVEEWKDFRDCVAKGHQPVAGGEVGKKAVAVALAVLKAGETRRPVKIK